MSNTIQLVNIGRREQKGKLQDCYLEVQRDGQLDRNNLYSFKRRIPGSRIGIMYQWTIDGSQWVDRKVVGGWNVKDDLLLWSSLDYESKQECDRAKTIKDQTNVLPDLTLKDIRETYTAMTYKQRRALRELITEYLDTGRIG